MKAWHEAEICLWEEAECDCPCCSIILNYPMENEKRYPTLERDDGRYI
jgi:hypothetical protein